MNTHKFRADANYWDNKLANYLHDPPDKALQIPGHEERGRVLLDVLGYLPTPDENIYQRADGIAAGMDRAQLPGYSQDESKNGAVDFIKTPILSHPTGEEIPILLTFPAEINLAEITGAMQSIIRKDLGERVGDKGLSDKFQNNPDAFSAARFHYFHHVFRERLAQENVGGLGGVWHRMPADTRIPDHSIWQHCALVSALTSCFQVSGQKQASIFVFNITPVQDFISRARKLRDFWIGSLILSWLAFEGIRQILYSLGADHVLYPSLIGQPMVNWLLASELELEWLNAAHKSDKLLEVASLPNKFVCLVPTGQEEKIALDIQKSIREAWTHLGDTTLERVEKVIARHDSCLQKQFQRQMPEFWNFHWVACPLLDESAQDSIKKLLHKEVWQKPLEFLESSRDLPYQTKGERAFYGITHAMAQSFLAAGKTRRIDHRSEEPGIKCNLHGDLEALHCEWGDGDDRNPLPARDPFWSAFKNKWKPESDFKPSERLSAVALVKRLAYRVCKEEMPEKHPLSSFFKDAESFPSTTEMALADWLDRVEEKGLAVEFKKDRRAKLAQVVHEREPDSDTQKEGQENADVSQEERAICLKIIDEMERADDPIRDDDKYYAILLMDGDHMGRLVNGETLASRWDTVLHPDLVVRLKKPEFDDNYRAFWKDKLDKQRLLAPSTHAAISEALGDFSLYTVPRIINKYHGRLIYAGGDDICAILPVSTVLQAAREIAENYSRGFLFFPSEEKKEKEIISETWAPASGRLALHLGQGGKISISAGILIAHHKKPLTVAMRQARGLLESAKKEGGRNGFALELEKRSGGGRVFMAQWKEKPFEDLNLTKYDPYQGDKCLLDHFLAVGEAMNRTGSLSMSTSLAYRLQELGPGLKAIINDAPQELVKFLYKQITRSGKEENKEKKIQLACQLAALIARKKEKVKIDTECLVMAKFIGGRVDRTRSDQGGQQ